ncbi:MAG TPA: putative lipid II flippase FtsW [Candidatus Mediterraneibacter guildfordensis]|nr:putative lipid II flippase FtsW [Candidatus Mediterraneibacter guildfordensis]
MKSRIVRPVRQHGQSGKKNRNSRARLGETQPMRTAEVRAGYAGYQKSLDRRREIVNTPRTRAKSRTAKPVRAKRSWLGSIISTKSMGAEQYFDFDLLLVVIFLLGFGLVMLYSTSAYEAEVELGNDLYYFSRQALIGVAGFIIMIFISRIDYHVYGAFAMEIYVFAMFMMVLVKTPLGMTLNGARRWIRLPGNLTLQPAEITKIAVVLFIAYELCRLGRKAYTMEGIIRVFVFGAIASGGVLFLTDNLSTAIIVMGITCILIFVSHPKLKPFLFIIVAGILVAVVGIAILSVTAANSDNFRLQRIISWLNPEATADSGSYQVMQGLYAIGSGGLFGKGLGNSTQKLGVIPEAQNDMILVVICEELGIFGAFIILLLFGLLLYRLMFIAQNAPDLYGSLIATGIFAHIALQVILNIAVVTGMLPTTGITLPFISYGGTAIVFLLAEMGIALGISRRIRLEG